MNHTIDRDGQYDFRTPTESDRQCDYFYDRFIELGSMRERRAICDMHDEQMACDYRKLLKDGTPLCLRYWYGPFFEKEVGRLPDHKIKRMQKVDADGKNLYWIDDGTGTETMIETTEETDAPVMVPIDERYPVPYVVDNMVHEKDETGALLFWDKTLDPPEKTTADTGIPSMLKTQDEWYSTQHIDTHGKVFSTRGNELGWRHKV